MWFTLYFQNFPNLAAMGIECGVNGKQMSVFPKHFVGCDNWRDSFYFLGSDLYLAAVILPIEVDMKAFMCHFARIKGLPTTLHRSDSCI